MKKLNYLFAFALIASMLAMTSCHKEKKVKSMEEIYAENGRPVVTRKITPENFSVLIKFPADIALKSQSVAYAKINDVIRDVYFKVGDTVKRDQVVLSFSTDNVEYRQAKIQFENAKLAFERASNLYKTSDISRKDFDNAKAEYNIAREALKSRDDIIFVKSPIDGKITQMNATVSANKKEGDALFSVGNQNGYEATFYVLPGGSDYIKPGAKAYINLWQDGSKIEGRISEVGLTMDPQIRAFLVKAFFEGDNKYLSSGMHVDLEVEIYNDPKAIILKQSEMVRSFDQWSAYTVENGIAKKHDLKIRYNQDLDYYIDSGIVEGDVIISEGAQFVTDGTKVLPTEAVKSSEEKTANEKATQAAQPASATQAPAESGKAQSAESAPDAKQAASQDANQAAVQPSSQPTAAGNAAPQGASQPPAQPSSQGAPQGEGQTAPQAPQQAPEKAVEGQ